MYLRERVLGANAHPFDRLRLSVVAAVASVRLLAKKYVEPAGAGGGVTTVAIQQTLSIIAEQNGTDVPFLYEAVCAGPQSLISKRAYVELLRYMASPTVRLLEQAPDGMVMLGSIGERLTRGRDFFAIFETDEEWTVRSEGRKIGTLPLANMVKANTCIAFGGQRWRVQEVDLVAKILDVAKDSSAKVPSFDALGREGISEVFAQEMKSVLASEDMPEYLCTISKELLTEGRSVFLRANLEKQVLWEEQGGVTVLTWAGTDNNYILSLILTYLGYDASADDIGVIVRGADLARVKTALRTVASTPPKPEDVAKIIPDIRQFKYDEYAPIAVLEGLWAKTHRLVFDRVASIANDVVKAIEQSID
jgi:ATP-dependent helicase Lhr and Lhr-like helicase